MAEPTNIVPKEFIRPGYNGTGTAMVQGQLVKLKASATIKDDIELATGATDPVYGAVMDPSGIADAARGNIQVMGRAKVLADGTIAVGARITATTGGESTTASAGNTCAGVAVTAGVADTLHEVELNGPGGAEMPG